MRRAIHNRFIDETANESNDNSSDISAMIAYIYFNTASSLGSACMGHHRGSFLFSSNLSVLALVTMRSAPETLLAHHINQPLDAFMPAAAAWISTLGPQIYYWDEEFEHGPLRVAYAIYWSIVVYLAHSANEK